MNIKLRVNRVSTHSVEVPVDYQGERAMAMLPELQVEMHDEENIQGSLTLHLRSRADIAAAQEIFESGGYATLSFEKHSGPPVAAEAEPAPEPAA